MQRVRVFFTKQNEAAYISHLDLQRVMARGLRKSGLPVWYSKGFNPHIYMSFALPLPLMQESVAESVDCRLDDEDGPWDISLKDYIQPLSDALPTGIDVTGITEPVYDAGEIGSAAYWMGWPGREDELVSALEAYNAVAQAIVIRKTKRTQSELNLKEYLPVLAIGDDSGGFRITLPAGSDLNLNPALLAEYLTEYSHLPQGAARIVREQVFTKSGEIFR